MWRGMLVGNTSLLVGNTSNMTDVGGSIFDKTEFPPGFLPSSSFGATYSI